MTIRKSLLGNKKNIDLINGQTSFKAIIQTTQIWHPTRSGMNGSYQLYLYLAQLLIKIPVGYVKIIRLIRK